ncbi:MAG: ATP-binding protein [bacterium]
MSTTIKRKLYNSLRKHLKEKEISLIIGPRQAGKTTLMKNLKDELDKKGEKTLFLNMDIAEDRTFFATQQSLIEKISLSIGKDRGFVFLDEIQRKEDAGLFLKGIYDMNLPYKFIISGSGSVELKEKIHESLAGRKRIFELFTISFEEFVDFKTNYSYSEKLENFFSVEKSLSDRLLKEYLNFGGYPQVVIKDTLEEKIFSIREILSSYLEKDINSLLHIEKLETFNLLIKILSNQTGKILNYTELSNSLAIQIPTLKKYIWYIEKTFVATRISPFFRNTRKEIKKSPMIYFYDIGLHNYALNTFGNLERAADIGFVFQNLIFLLLREKLLLKNAGLNFWRTKDKNEVDFVIDFTRDVIPIEAKYSDLREPIIPRPLRNFIKKYNPSKAFVINKSLDSKINFLNTEILIIPYWKLITEEFF